MIAAAYLHSRRHPHAAAEDAKEPAAPVGLPEVDIFEMYSHRLARR